MKAIDDGHGTQHGAWWNAVVWSECKAMAARYFDELESESPEAKDFIQQIASSYREGERRHAESF